MKQNDRVAEEGGGASDGDRRSARGSERERVTGYDREYEAGSAGRQTAGRLDAASQEGSDPPGGGPRRRNERSRDVLHRTVGNQGVQRLHERGEVRAKSAISSPHDPEEREARQVARRVVSMDVGEGSDASDPLDGVLRPGGIGGTDGVARSSDSTSGILSSGGQKLPDATRQFFEERFGRGFDDVRIHTGPSADSAASAIDAEAFTLGRDVAFAAGNYQPHTRSGKELLAHELTHVVQQREGTGRGARIQREGGWGDYHHPEKFKGHFSTFEKVVGVTRQLAPKASDVDQLFLQLRTVAQRSEKRYLLLDTYTPVLDIKHFFFAAHEAYSGGPTKEQLAQKIPGGETIREYMPSIPLWTSETRAVDMGDLLEFQQWLEDHPSAFSSEDRPSNRLGAKFGVRVSRRVQKPSDFPGVLETFLKKYKPKDPGDVSNIDEHLSGD